MSGTRKAGGRGPGGTTKEDWVRAALDTLINEGVDQVKVLTLAADLGIARSSFYWYFKNRSELLEALLDHWALVNTKVITEAANSPAQSINYALGQLYAGWLSGESFDTSLDFAIRDWARRSGSVRRALDMSDTARIEAIAAMFRRYDYPANEADVRARVIYFTQIGYATVDQRETWETRLKRSEEYLFCMTGVRPTPEEIAYLVGATKDALASVQ